MAYDDNIIKMARNAYVFKSMPLTKIAEQNDLPMRTLTRWKSEAKSAGDCWNTARTNALMASNGTDGLDVLLNEFITFFNSTMDEVQSSEDITALDKVNAISGLGNAYTKVIKSANRTDPKKTQFAIALDVLKQLVVFLEQKDDKSALEALAPELESFGNYYKQVAGKK